MLRWGIVGVGRAGQARARAIVQDPRSEAVLGFRGDPRAVGLKRAASLRSLIDGVDAVAICSPDVTHPSIIRAALAEGRHVVVEFPLAGTTKVARELLELAEEEGLVLHVEHIELLCATARYMREAALERTLTGESVSFVGAKRRGTYGTAHANLARLHRVVDAIGLPDAVQVFERGPRFVKGSMCFGDAELAVEFRQADDQPRATELRLDFDDGQLIQRNRQVFRDDEAVDLPELPPLFQQDQEHATARILDGAAGYLDTRRILDVISLADALVRASPGGGWEDFVSATAEQEQAEAS